MSSTPDEGSRSLSNVGLPRTDWESLFWAVFAGLGPALLYVLLRSLRVPFYRRCCFAQALSQPALLRRLQWSSLAAFSPYWTLF